MELTFKRSAKSDAQFVYNGDALVGAVRKNEHWTVRGTRIDWTASRNGRVIGNAETRKAAAELLVRQ